MGKVPISCGRGNNKLTHANCNLAVPKEAKKVETKTSLNANIPVDASIWWIVTLPNCSRTEDENGDCNPEAKEKSDGYKHHHWHQDCLTFFLSEFCCCFYHNNTDTDLSDTAHQDQERYSSNYEWNYRDSHQQRVVMQIIESFNIDLSFCSEEENDSHGNDSTKVKYDNRDDETSPTGPDKEHE